MGPKDPRSTVLTVEEEAIAVAFRKHTLLPLDDCLYALQATIPHLTRSSLHRLLSAPRHQRLPDIEGDKPAKKTFKAYPIGFFHIDIAEVQTAQGKLFLFVAIDRTSKFAFAKLAEKANRVTASAFLTALIEAVPYNRSGRHRLGERIMRCVVGAGRSSRQPLPLADRIDRIEAWGLPCGVNLRQRIQHRRYVEPPPVAGRLQFQPRPCGLCLLDALLCPVHRDFLSFSSATHDNIIGIFEREPLFCPS
jgi:hypothetical protein